MKAVGEALTEIGTKWRARLDPWDQGEIDDVLDAAVEWQAGRLPTFEFARIGGIRESASYTRYVAMLCSCGDSRQASLRSAIEALLTAQGYVFTNHGMFTPEELGEAGMTVRWRNAA